MTCLSVESTASPIRVCEHDDLILTKLPVLFEPSGSKINLLICHIRSYLTTFPLEPDHNVWTSVLTGNLVLAAVNYDWPQGFTRIFLQCQKMWNASLSSLWWFGIFLSQYFVPQILKNIAPTHPHTPTPTHPPHTHTHILTYFQRKQTGKWMMKWSKSGLWLIMRILTVKSLILD